MSAVAKFRDLAEQIEQAERDGHTFRAISVNLHLLDEDGADDVARTLNLDIAKEAPGVTRWFTNADDELGVIVFRTDADR